MIICKAKENGVSLLGNGTLLFTPAGRDNIEDAKLAMEEARFLIDCEVGELKEGGYLIRFHKALAVYVSQDEFETMKSEITDREEKLKFPEEVFFGKNNATADHFLIGLYTRGKLQYDAYNFHFYSRINDNEK